MTPKEKAGELISKFTWPQRAFEQLAKVNVAKECALVCVDEILLNFDGLNKPEYCAFDAIGQKKYTFAGEYSTHLTGYDMQDYWKEVRKHLEAI